MMIDTADLTSQLRGLESRLTLDVAVHDWRARQVRGWIVTTVVLAALSVALVAYSVEHSAAGRTQILRLQVRDDAKLDKLQDLLDRDAKSERPASQPTARSGVTSSGARALPSCAGTGKSRARHKRREAARRARAARLRHSASARSARR